MKKKVLSPFILFIFPFFLIIFPVKVYPQWIASYTAVPPPIGSAWFEFDFASADTGYLVMDQYWSVSVGYNYMILKTTNGGVSWNTIDGPEQSNDSPNGAYVIDISVPDADTIFYTTRDYFNFLNRWTRQCGTSSYKLWGELPRDLSVVDGHEAFVLTMGLALNNVSVYYFNGDSTHRVFESSSLKTDQTSRIFFITPQVGFIVVKDLSMAVVMMKSLDGGNTFTPVALPSGMTVNALFFTSVNSGFIAGDGGLIYQTVNQGATWQQLNTGTTATFNSIHFADSMTGIAGGNGGTAIITTDGGQTWHAEPGNGNLTTVQVFSPNQAYTCNNNYFPIFYKGIYPVSSPSESYPLLSIYPNPAENELIVGIPDQGHVLPRFEISGITGEISIQGILANDHVIKVKQLPSGVYFLKLFLQKTTVIKKIIKK